MTGHQQSNEQTPAASGQALSDLWPQVEAWARELGFSQIGVSGVDLSAAEPGLLAWLEAGFQGEMAYMASHGLKRARPAELVPGTLSVITARLDYLPADTPGLQQPAHRVPVDHPDSWTQTPLARLSEPGQAVVSLYAHGRDYHKVLRQRLARLAQRLSEAIGPFGHRVFTDSAPVLEVELAQRSGLGWRGKHTLLLSREQGSFSFLGEIYTDLALAPTPPTTAHCGNCEACLNACPTGAIVAPYRLDARRCISYLTIESDDPIPLALRPLMGNRIYGCDDCQLVCPWNRHAQVARLPDFDERNGWRRAELLSLWAWDEAEWLRRTEGSALRRIGFTRWRRNLAVAIGNTLRSPDASLSLRQRLREAIVQSLEWQAAERHPLVHEHLVWAMAEDGASKESPN
jgi:epoxyqueuosine reductase